MSMMGGGGGAAMPPPQKAYYDEDPTRSYPEGRSGKEQVWTDVSDYDLARTGHRRIGPDQFASSGGGSRSGGEVLDLLTFWDQAEARNKGEYAWGESNYEILQALQLNEYNQRLATRRPPRIIKGGGTGLGTTYGGPINRYGSGLLETGTGLSAQRRATLLGGAPTDTSGNVLFQGPHITPDRVAPHVNLGFGYEF